MTAPRTATCPTCSTVVSESDRFCKSCGTVVSGISASLPIGGGGYAPSAPAAAEAPLSATSPWELVLSRLRAVTGGEFEIGRELGRGGMAAVFLAQDLALNRRVAIKVMAPGLMLGEGMVQRFRQEAITIANLSHAHIVTIHAVRQLQDLHFFVMQFVEGQSLETVLRAHGPLPVEVVRVILHHVGSALAYAHRRGVVHRDIKPGNILLSGDGDALVTDFGIAKVAEGPTQTQTGMVVGTPTYMSPEQCYAQELDGSSDQYSLGIVAYQMLTGHVPFTGAAFEIMRGHTTDPVPPMRAVRPDMPESVESAVLRMLAKKPSERFASFGEALSALGAHAIGEDSPLRADLVRLAAVEERAQQLGDLLRTPSTPLSGTRRRSTSGVSGAAAPAIPAPPNTPPAVTPAPVATAPSTSAPSTSPGAPPAAPFADAPTRVAALSLAALPSEVRVGDTFRVHATPMDAAGQPLARPVAWSAVGAAVEVSTDGTVRAIAAGRSVLNAACDEFYETVVLTVLPVSAATSGAGVVLPAAASEVAPAPALSATAVLAGGPAPSPPPSPSPRPTADASSSEPPAAGRPRWLIAAAAVPLLLIAFLLLRPSAEQGAGTVQTAAVPTTTATVAPDPVQPPPVEPEPEVADSATSPPAPPVTETSSPTPAPSVRTLRFVTPTSTTLRPSETLQLRVSARDAGSGRDVPTPPVSFRSSDGRVARVDSRTGLVTAVGAGRATVTADAGDDVRATITLTVAAAVAVAPATTESAPVADPPVTGGANTPPPNESVVTRPTTPPPTTGTPPAPAPTVPVATAAELEAQARNVITAYARAYESRELDRVRAVWPGLSDGYAAELNTFFDLARDVRVSISGIDAANGYDGAPGAITRVVARVNIRFNDGRRGQSQSDRWAVSLRREGAAWRIVSVGPP